MTSAPHKHCINWSVMYNHYYRRLRCCVLVQKTNTVFFRYANDPIGSNSCHYKLVMLLACLRFSNFLSRHRITYVDVLTQSALAEIQICAKCASKCAMIDHLSQLLKDLPILFVSLYMQNYQSATPYNIKLSPHSRRKPNSTLTQFFLKLVYSTSEYHS